MILFYSGTGVGNKSKYTAPEEFSSTSRKIGFMLTFNDFNLTKSSMSIGRFKNHRKRIRRSKNEK